MEYVVIMWPRIAERDYKMDFAIIALLLEKRCWVWKPCFFLKNSEEKAERRKDEEQISKFTCVFNAQITLAINNMHMHIVSKILMSMKISKLLQVKYGRTTKIIISIGRKMIWCHSWWTCTRRENIEYSNHLDWVVVTFRTIIISITFSNNF